MYKVERMFLKHNNSCQWSRGMLKTALAFAAACLFAACGIFESDDAGCESGVDDSRTYMQVRVKVDATARSRAPQGGEDGDCRETGVNHENDIHDVTLLLYTTNPEDAGINATDGQATLTHALYFPSVGERKTAEDGSSAYYETAPREMATPLDITKRYHVIVIANAGDLTQELSGMSLPQIRDYLVTQAWREATAISDYDNFVMSSERDDVLSFDSPAQTGTGTRQSPYLVETHIERLAARLDFDTSGGMANSEGNYIYDVYDDVSGGQPIGKFVLRQVMPFNQMVYGSTLIKRVATNNPVHITYLGEETAEQGVATNYVLDALYETEKNSSYYRNYVAVSSELDGVVIPTLWNVSGKSKVGSNTYYILDYTLENTTLNNATDFATGLLFRGTYYTNAEWGDGSPSTVGTTKTYPYYIRHSDPTGDGTTADPMHYGIVRNNIYRVKISRVIEEPTTSDISLAITINVRKWALYEHSEIVM